MSIFNSLEFDGVNSLDNDVYITGESVYDAPERDVEVVEIAGRNGNFLLDKGRWKNIEVTYHCGTFGLDQTEFGTKMRAFRNKLASKIGYMRLADTYHPDEFRMGTFKSALEVDPVSYKRAGEFDVKFDCKPQRWLTSGESAVTVSDGDSFYNPTPFDASPLLMVEGYGTIGFNGYEIEIENAVMGEVELYQGNQGKGYVYIPKSQMAVVQTGDIVTVAPATLRLIMYPQSYQDGTVTNVEVSSISQGYEPPTITTNGDEAFVTLPQVTYNYQGASQSATLLEYTIQFAVTVKPYGTAPSQVHTLGVYIKQHVQELGANVRFEIVEQTVSGAENITCYANPIVLGRITADSSLSILGHPTYIDCDLGDAYMIKDGSYISLNSYIDLGSDLPVLASGNNELSVDSTITELKIVPRWWIL